PSREELDYVTHHFIGNLSIHDYYNVFKYESDALQLLSVLFQSMDVVIAVGGSGLYIDTLCHSIDLMPDASPELREQLNRTFETQGIMPLRSQLKLLDPISYDTIDIANPKRIIRALEVCLTTGRPYSASLKNKTTERPFRIIKIGLNRDRSELYEIINHRVEIMIEQGLEAEARDLYNFKGITALNTVGYREMFSYFEGEYSLKEAIDKIKVNTRRYAKKQLTWFARDKEFQWFHPSAGNEIIRYIKAKM
ncbi:MAG: tRNA (adenosine(37)-N6)-dimethylallyltransferase MiaA, partial [Bacteroidota bacterium]